MTDKIQKTREEVERLINELIQERGKDYSSDVDDACILELQNVLTYIDSLQEEPMPKFKAGDRIRPIDSSLGAPRTILEVCDGWYVTNQETLDFEFEDNWELVSEELEEAAKRYSDNEDPICTCEECLLKSFKAGAEWQEGKDDGRLKEIEL